MASLLLLLGMCCLLPSSSAHAHPLPDGRVYELVTRYEEGGHEVGLNGVEAGYGVPSVNGEALDWGGIGGCCGATSAAYDLYQSVRGPSGWQTRSISPAPKELLIGLFEEQVPMFWTGDLSKTIFTTPVSYAAGDRRPPRSRTYDLYLEEPDGSLDWLSQGPSGTGEAPDSAYFDGATPDASEVAFSSAEQLTPNAVGVVSTNKASDYLYVRNVNTGTTQLVDVDNSGKLLGEYGASLGNGSWLSEPTLPVDYKGTTTNAISADGSKLFFETPPEGTEAEVQRGVLPHLYMRDLSTETTTPLDDPSSSGTAQYEGAAEDGSLVFFTSNEGLDGASTANELYEFNTTGAQIGAAPPMSAVAISAGGVAGVSAISNDGSHVFFVADDVLAANANSQGDAAVAGQPNLYVYDARSAQTTFIATLSELDVSECSDVCGTGNKGGLVAEPDIDRSAYPTPDGSVFAFLSAANLTGQNTPPETTLTVATSGEPQTTINVASTVGFLPHHIIEIGSGSEGQLEEVETVDSPTELTLSEEGDDGAFRDLDVHEVGASVSQPALQAYRYSSAENSLICISCVPPGVSDSGSATMGAGGGGSYAPQGQTVPLTEDGSRIFFESPDPLVAGVAPPTPGEREPRNVYEWENGQLSLISEGSGLGAGLDGTTPSGRDVFLATRAQLAGTETGGVEMIYDAREGGGFPHALPPPPCVGSACRPNSGSGVFFPEPSSATLAPVTVGRAAPHLIIARITAAQRRELARTGRITLRVTSTAPGQIFGDAVAKMHGRTERVAHTSASLANAGTIALKLRLSAAARRALLSSGSLALRFEVQLPAQGIVAASELELAGDKPAAASRRR